MPARTTKLERGQPRNPGAKAARAIADPKRRLAKVIDLLEDNLGEPFWEGKRDALEVLVLTILSQNTADPNALKAYLTLVDTFPATQARKGKKDASAIPRLADGSVDPVAIRLSQVADAVGAPDWLAVLKAPVASVKKAIKFAGLANTKGPAIQTALAWVHERSESFDFEAATKGMDAAQASIELAKLKGIGLKTVGVTFLEAWGADLCPVDTHVHRLVNRLGIVQASGPDRTYHLLTPLVAKGKGFSLHHNLLTFGRTICNAKKPQCAECYLQKLCPWEGKAARMAETE